MISLVTKIQGGAQASRKLSAWRTKLPKAADRAAKQQAQRLRTLIVQGIRSGGPGDEEFEPLADSTVDMKGSSKPLIDNGDMIRSIGVEELETDAWFVGVNRQAETEEGMPLENLAEIHEFGTDPYEIQVTQKMRGFFAHMAKKGIFDNMLSPSTMVIQHPGIPARPFLEPAFEEWAEDAEEQFEASVKRQLGIR